MLLTALLLRAALADEIPCDPAGIDGYISEVTTGSPEAYRCLAALDGAGAALLEAVEGADDPPPQVTRALTVYWMQRLDQPLPHEVARALPASDRRLLSDAVRARLGRASPAPAHASVFEQFDWYQPDPRYTDRRLSEQDRANLDALAAPPPEPPPPEAPSAAEVIADAAATPATERGCSAGCATGHPVGILSVVFGFLFVWVRRRSS